MNKTIIKKNKDKISFTFVLKLTKTIILTTVVFCLLMIVLYIIGNYQNFQDKSQQVILDAISYVSICTLFLTIPVIVENIIRLITTNKKWECISTILLMILVILIMIGCMSFSSIIEFLSEGL